MKIAIVCQHLHLVGGIETYLQRVIPALQARGHELAVFHEFDGDAGRQSILSDANVRHFRLTLENAAPLQEWNAELIYAHGLSDPEMEFALLGSRPVITFAHGYPGACISGTRCHAAPHYVPCGIPFSPACLAVYLPRRCGGLNPITMLREYSKNNRRFEFLSRCRGVAVASGHMLEIYQRQGLSHDLTVVGLPIESESVTPIDPPVPSGDAPWRLLYLGRAQEIKGGGELLKALPLIKSSVHLTIAGEGEALEAWRAEAKRITEQCRHVKVTFAGWLNSAARNRLFEQTHLLVVPSLWPEPFGMVGVEAGHFGIPCVAFASGGVRDWLEDTANGHLAPANPPTAGGLAAAINRCLEDRARYEQMRVSARRLAQRFSMERHLEKLEKLFEKAVEQE